MTKSTLIIQVLIFFYTDLFAQSLQQLNILPDDVDKVERLLSFSTEALKENKDLADSAALAAYAIAEKINYPLGKAKALVQRSKIISNNNYPSAEKYLRSALELLASPGDEQLFNETKKLLGTNLVRQSKFDEAEKLFRETFAYGVKENKQALVGDAYLGLANIATAKSDFVTALQNYLEAAKIREALADKSGMAIVYNNIAVNLKEQERYEESLTYHFKSLALKKELGNKSGIASSYTNIGVLYNRLKKYQSALQYYTKGMELAIAENDDKNLSNIYTNMGVTYRNLKEPDKAISYLKKSLAMKERLNNLSDIAGCNYNLANVYFDKQDYILSGSYLDKAEKLNLVLQEKTLEAKILELRTKLLEAGNHQKEAFETFKKSVQVKDSIFSIDRSKQLQEILTKYETEKKDRQLAENKFQLQKAETELTQKKFTNYILSGSIAALVIILVFAIGYYMQRQKVVQHQKEIEKQKAVIEERNRIANDMHDDLGAGLSTIKMMGEMAMAKSPGDGNAEMQKITQSASELIDSMRAIVWSISSRNDSLEDLLLYIRKYSFEFLEQHKIECTMDIPEDIPHLKLSAGQRRNIFLVLKESLHNTVKHASATHVEIKIKTNPVFAVAIHDNGKGYETTSVNRFGNGLKNMQRRMEDIGGTFSIENKQGTTVICECVFGAYKIDT
ncbi:MAG: tetratricopeptide repeat protein [Bacteroidia bacterium]